MSIQCKIPWIPRAPHDVWPWRTPNKHTRTKTGGQKCKNLFRQNWSDKMWGKNVRDSEEGQAQKMIFPKIVPNGKICWKNEANHRIGLVQSLAMCVGYRRTHFGIIFAPFLVPIFWPIFGHILDFFVTNFGLFCDELWTSFVTNFGLLLWQYCLGEIRDCNWN